MPCITGIAGPTSAGVDIGETVAKVAERCEVAYSTPFRWRHRFLSALNLDKPQCLPGIVEGDVGGGLGVPGAGKTWTLTPARRADAVIAADSVPDAWIMGAAGWGGG